MDYINVNLLSQQIPGDLPDIKDIVLMTRNFNWKFFGTINLSDTFCSIPLHVASRDIITFTYNNKQYRFKRLSEGYKNIQIIAHMTLRWSLE